MPTNQKATTTTQEANQNSTSTLLTYKNSKYGFEFQYPSEVDLNERNSTYVLNKNLSNEKSYQSIEIELHSKENPKAWMGIEIVLNNDQSLKDAALEDIAVVSQNAEMGDNTNFSPETIATSSEIIDGRAAEKIVFNAYIKEGVVIKDNANLYIVDQFGMDNFDKILSTFKFKK